MAFVVDGAEWRFDGWQDHVIAEAIDNLLERIRVARDRDETVWIGDDLQLQPILGDLDLWSLCSPDAPIRLSAEIWQELAAWLLVAPRYFDEADWPDGIEETAIEVNGASEDNADVAWAHYNVLAGRAVACLSLTRDGPLNTRSTKGSASVYWVRTEATHRAFWRAAIVLEGDNAGTLERLAAHAFPDLYFVDGLWAGLNDLAGGYLALRSKIQRYLAVLNDFGNWAFTFPPPALAPGELADPKAHGLPSNQIIERRFQGLGLEMAPEKPNVGANSTCRRAREVTIQPRTLYCEWHAKLELHRNRIHIHSPIAETHGKVVIAIFHEHLPLPA